MGILRYALSDEECGNENRIVGLLLKAGLPNDSVHIDRDQGSPQILIESCSQEMGQLIRTIAQLFNLRRQRPPVPKNETAH